jgi:hypothetical protein
MLIYSDALIYLYWRRWWWWRRRRRRRRRRENDYNRIHTALFQS